MGATEIGECLVINKEKEMTYSMNHLEGSQRGEFLICSLGDFVVGLRSFVPSLQERLVVVKLKTAVVQFLYSGLAQVFLGAFRRSRRGQISLDKLRSCLWLGLHSERGDDTSHQFGIRGCRRRCSNADSY